jgi:hypothetical protein
MGASQRQLLTNFTLLALFNFLIHISNFNASEWLSTLQRNLSLSGPLPFKALAHLGPLD